MDSTAMSYNVDNFRAATSCSNTAETQKLPEEPGGRSRVLLALLAALLCIQAAAHRLCLCLCHAFCSSGACSMAESAPNCSI